MHIISDCPRKFKFVSFQWLSTIEVLQIEEKKAYEYVSCETVLFYLIKKDIIVQEDQGE